ncbi:MAG: hypothetical protein ACREGE_03615 [Candidatus Microsaccharimonas sp.]
MKRLQQLNKRTLIIAALLVVAGIVVAGAGVSRIILDSNAQVNQTAKDGTSPEFRALLPAATSIDDLGGWNKQTSPGGEVYFVFLDTINTTTIRVSQQELPESLQKNTSTSIAELAKGYNANRTLDVGNTKVFIGINTKGQQSIIFTRNSLLVLIVSEQTIPDDAWTQYIENLR